MSLASAASESGRSNQRRCPSSGSPSSATSFASTWTNTSPDRASRTRLDLALVQQRLAETRERAHALILAGKVLVDDVPARRPAQLIRGDSRLQVRRDEASSYVSRGAQKLQVALDAWPVQVSGSVALDVGASTGGFTELLLRRGARRVYAVDVGYGQLHYRLRQDPRVVVMERTNARYLSELPEMIEVATADVSFISLRLALPAVFGLLAPTAAVVALVKPQFEAGREQVGRGGVVRDPAVHERVLVELARWSESRPWQLTDALPSPIRGPAGNIEFLSLWQRDARLLLPETAARVVLAAAEKRTGNA